MIRSAIIRSAIIRSVIICALAAASALAYIRNTPSSGVPLYRADATGVQFLLNNQIAPGQGPMAQGSDPAAAVRAALECWNAVSSSVARFKPLQTTSAGHDASDRQNVIAVADMSDPAIASMMNGAVAITIPAYVISQGSKTNSQIVDSDILLNPQCQFSTTGAQGAYDLQAVLTHELGHALGADHSGIVGASMFQAAYPNQRFLSIDDIVFATASYPASGSQPLGTLHGTVRLADGSAAGAALITASDPAQGYTIGGLARNDGTYSMSVPAGHYTVYAEPLGPGIVAAANIASVGAMNGASFRAAMFQPALASSPASLNAGGSAAVDVSVRAGAPAIDISYSAVIPAGSRITELHSFNGPVMVNSGQTVDLAMIGTGVDETMNVNVLGRGVHLISLRRDPSVQFGGSLAGLPIVRATLQIDAQDSASLASVFASRGTNSVAYSGILLVTPPTPVFDANGIVSSASFQGRGVSPGGLYTIFGAAGALGPIAGIAASGLNAYGKLPTTLARVSVTFDGVPAPLFYVQQGMINLQVPFEVAANIGASNSTRIVVNYDGAASAAVQAPVEASQPAVFTLASDGGADSIVVNPDGAVNSAGDPAAKGSYVVVYGTGVGNPACNGYNLQTGLAAPNPPGGCTATYSASFGSGAPSPVSFAGWTPALIGLAQWNVRIPPDVPSGAVSFTLTDSASGATSQTGTVYAK